MAVAGVGVEESDRQLEAFSLAKVRGLGVTSVIEEKKIIMFVEEPDAWVKAQH